MVHTRKRSALRAWCSAEFSSVKPCSRLPTSAVVVTSVGMKVLGGPPLGSPRIRYHAPIQTENGTPAGLGPYLKNNPSLES
jgi:hypothetical protein